MYILETMNATKLSEQTIQECLEQIPKEKIEKEIKMLEDSRIEKGRHLCILAARLHSEIIDIRLDTLKKYRESLDKMPKDLVLERACDILWDWIQHSETHQDCYDEHDDLLKRLGDVDTALTTLEIIMNVEKAKRFNLL